MKFDKDYNGALDIGNVVTMHSNCFKAKFWILGIRSWLLGPIQLSRNIVRLFNETPFFSEVPICILNIVFFLRVK